MASVIWRWCRGKGNAQQLWRHNWQQLAIISERHSTKPHGIESQNDLPAVGAVWTIQIETSQSRLERERESEKDDALPINKHIRAGEIAIFCVKLDWPDNGHYNAR